MHQILLSSFFSKEFYSKMCAFMMRFFAGVEFPPFVWFHFSFFSSCWGLDRIVSKHTLDSGNKVVSKPNLTHIECKLYFRFTVARLLVPGNSIDSNRFFSSFWLALLWAIAAVSCYHCNVTLLKINGYGSKE